MNGKENQNNVNSSSYIIKKINTNIEKENLKLIHWNCNSLNNKIEEFKSFCITFNPQVISLNETKMSEFKAKYILNINNYTTIHKARNYSKNDGGGVALLIRKDIKFSDCRLFDSLDLEICAINLSINGKETCVITYYNPPNLKLSEEVFHILRTF
jgi:exonuclease III